MKPLIRILVAFLAFLLAIPALAQPYPNRPIRVIIPYAAGGSLDVVARVIGQRFQDQTGQPLVIENRGGAGGLIGAEVAAKAAPDGYTLIMANAAQISIAPALYDKMPFDPAADLVPVTHLVATPMILFVTAKSPMKSVAEIVAAAKATPGEVPFATPGNGTVGHLAMEMFAQRTGAKFLHVPYKGAAQALNDMAGGTLDVTFTLLASARGLMDGGVVKPLAIASAQRSPSLPQVPTFAELGLAGVDAPVWLGMMAPKGTPAETVAKLDDEFRNTLAAPEVKDRLAQAGADITGYGPKEFGAMIKEDTSRWHAVVTKANIKLEP